MFTFFDELPENNAQHYFNILTICVEVAQDYWDQIFPQELDEVWYLQDITSSRPKAYHFYIEEDLDEDFEYEITYFPHTVIAITQDNQILCYEMLDFDTIDPWYID